MKDGRSLPSPPEFNLEAHRRAHRGLCPTAEPPTNSTLLFDTIDGHARHRIRAYIRCDEMADAKSYVGNLQISKDGGTTPLTPYRRKEVKAKDDDANTTVEVPMGLVRKGWKVRYRVRTVTDCRGSWGPGTSLIEADAIKGWSVWFDPDDTEAPPAVTGLTLDVDEHRCQVRYLIPDDPLNGAADDPRIAHEWIELWRTALDTGTLEAQDRHHRGERWSHKISKPHGDTFYARVYTVSATGVKSTAATTSATKNTPSQPAAPTVAFDEGGPKLARVRALVTVAAVAATDRDILKYRVKVVHKATNATPTTGDKRNFHHIPGDAAGDELVAVFKSIPKDDWVFAATQAVDTQGKFSLWSPWSTGAQSGKTDGGGGKTKIPFHVRGLIRTLAEADVHDMDIDEPLTLVKLRLRLKQAIVGDTLTVDAYKNNTTLVGTATITTGTKRGVNNSLSVAFADTDSISLAITVGSGATFPGKHLAVVAIFDPA